MPPDDDIHGWRTHAWLLILPGAMDVSEPFFIEPSEGKGYPINAKQYHQIESVYNNENYYVSATIKLIYHFCYGLQLWSSKGSRRSRFIQ